MDFIKNIFQKKENINKINTSEFGVSGTQNSGDIFLEEEQNELSFLNSRMDVYERMFRSEPIIRTSLNATTDPIVSARYYCQPADDSTESKKYAEFIENILINPNSEMSMRDNFSFYLRKIMSYNAFGFACFEVVWKIVNNYIIPDHFAERLQRTIKWNIEDDNLISISQNNYWSSNIKRKIQDIPNTTDKLLIFTNDQQGNDYEGRGVLRNQYRAWKMKQRMVNSLMVGYNRYLVGTLSCSVPVEGSQEDVIRVKKVGKNWNSHEKGVVIFPEGFDFQIHETNMQASIHALNFIKYLDSEMALAAFAQWILLGTNGTGSYALSSDQTDMAIMKLQGIIDYICDKITKLIKRIIYYNFGNEAVSLSPTLTGRLVEEDVNQWITKINACIQAGSLPVYKDLQNKIAQSFELPEIPDDAFMQEEQRLPEEKAIMQSENIKTRRELNLDKIGKVGGIKHFAEEKKIIEIKENELRTKLNLIIKKHQKQIFDELQNGVQLSNIKIKNLDEYKNILHKYMAEISINSVKNFLKEARKNETEAIKNIYKDLDLWAKKQAEAMTIKYNGDIIFEHGLLFNNAELNKTEPKRKDMINNLILQLLGEITEVFRKLDI
jgi:hypothetical protein